VINADLIEAVEADDGDTATVLTLVDGKRYVVQEGPDEVVELIRRYRITVLRGLEAPDPPPTRSAVLYALPTEGERS
jgi:flagellar protein FlbD